MQNVNWTEMEVFVSAIVLIVGLMVRAIKAEISQSRFKTLEAQLEGKNAQLEGQNAQLETLKTLRTAISMMDNKIEEMRSNEARTAIRTRSQEAQLELFDQFLRLILDSEINAVLKGQVDGIMTQIAQERKTLSRDLNKFDISHNYFNRLRSPEQIIAEYKQ